MTAYIGKHRAYIYQRPRQGSAFLDSFNISGYGHRIVASGGYESASGALDVTPIQAKMVFERYIGCIVRIYVDDPFNPIWEGFISRITYRVGGVMLTKSLDNMANRVSVTFYTADSVAATKTERTINYNNTASQAIYGVKEMSIDGGIHYADANKSHKNLLAQTLLAIRAWPQISTADGGGGGPLIEVEMQGLQYMAWDWQQYVLATTAVNTASAVFRRVAIATLAEAPSNVSFLYETDPTYALADRLVTTNATFDMPRGSEGGQTYLQFIKSIVEAGDGAKQYVYGITAPDPNLRTRLSYYKPADSTIKYHTSALVDPGIVRTPRGRIVPGWRVTPDGSVRVKDILIGYNQAGDDPRVGYIEAIEYDGDTGKVTLQSGDNITMEGALQKDRYFRAHGARERFGAPPRQTL